MNRRADPIAITHRQHRPRFESSPYRPSPGRREFIHGRVQPADHLVSFGRGIRTGRIALAIVAFALLVFGLQFARPLITAASAGNAFPAGTTSAPHEAGSAHHG